MERIAAQADKDIHRALDKMEEMLDEEEEGVSQFDYLELKSNLHELESGLLDARNGKYRALVAARSALNLADTVLFLPLDTLLQKSQWTPPDLDSLKALLRVYNPSLKRLNSGLAAKKEMIELSRAKLGPEFLVLGNFKWARSWMGDRIGADTLAFDEDPVHELTGMVGLGIRYKLNFWNTLSSYRKSKAEYQELKLKEAYADEGLFTLLEMAYKDYILHDKKLKSVSKSLRASEAWLKGAAMQYDLNPGAPGPLVKAYTKNISVKKAYYEAVYNYNLSVARLWKQVGYLPGVLDSQIQ
jgi:outer membrane protein TolC